MTTAQAGLLPNERLRPRAEQLRALYGNILDDVANYSGDLQAYFEPTASSAWVDTRTDVPHAVTAVDIAAFQALLTGLQANFSPAALALIAKFCVQPVAV
jgi:hypothetical protein